MKIHLIAVCGVGIGPLAGLLAEAGHEVRGSDERILPPMSEKLAARGVVLYEGHRPEHLDWGPDLVVIGGSVSVGNCELLEARRRGIAVESFPSALGRIFLEDKYPIVVAGTHGKTTTTSLISWLLDGTGRAPGFLIGGAPNNFAESFRDTHRGGFFVVEGDEYATAAYCGMMAPKFLHYRARMAVVTSIEHDHADIYADADEVAEAFRHLAQALPADGELLVARNAPGDAHLDQVASVATCRVQRYSVGSDADWRADVLEQGSHGARFSLRGPHADYGVFESPLPGVHNVYNATAALAASIIHGASAGDLRRALREFRGVKRRQEERGEAAGVLIIDDYAHHPTAVRETLRALKTKYPGRRLVAVYEPASWTSGVNCLDEEYVTAFDCAEEVVIAKPIFAARQPPSKRFDSPRLAASICERGIPAQCISELDDIVAHLVASSQGGDVVTVMSCGRFGDIHQKLLTALNETVQPASAPAGAEPRG